MTQEYAIELKEVSFSYGSAAPVLCDASLQLPSGSIRSIVGPNGGGKTTLLKLLMGLLEPTHGEVRVLGTTPCIARPRIGYMPQHTRYDPHFPVSAEDVVLMGRVERHAFGPYRKDDRKAARDTMERVGLSSERTRQFSDLSGGQKQRVLIARALVSDPEILLLDEPTAHVDGAAEYQFQEMLGSMPPDMTVLIVSHDLGFVSGMVEEVICVNQNVMTHAAHELTGKKLEDLYGGPLKAVAHDHPPRDTHGTGEHRGGHTHG